MTLTREQIEELRGDDDLWDDMGWDTRDALCDMALSSLPSGVMTKNVPVEPTVEMINAGHLAWVSDRPVGVGPVTAVWEAMLAAAPEAAPHQNAGLADRLKDLMGRWASVANDPKHGIGDQLDGDFDTLEEAVSALAGVAPRVGEDEEDLRFLLGFALDHLKHYAPGVEFPQIEKAVGALKSEHRD
jgi:hypothetical protein